MVGTIRILLGGLCLLTGAVVIAASVSPFNVYGMGYAAFILIVGIFLVLWGIQAILAWREARNSQLDSQRMQPGPAWQRPPSALPPPAPVYYQMHPPALPTERFCPMCGQSNARESAYCVRCGRPLPPPP